MEDLYKKHYPEELGKCFCAEEWNGFGFQSVGGVPDDKGLEGTLIILQFSEHPTDKEVYEGDEELRKAANDEIKAETVYVTDFLGRRFAGIKYTEWEKIPDLFNFFLDRGYSLCTHNKIEASFKPGDKFSWEEMEKRAISQFDEFMDMLTKDAGKTEKENAEFILSLRGRKDAFISHWNWHTQAGKDFCNRLRSILGFPDVHSDRPRYLRNNYDAMCQKYKVLHRGGWSAYEPSMKRVDEFLLVAHEPHN